MSWDSMTVRTSVIFSKRICPYRLPITGETKPWSKKGNKFKPSGIIVILYRDALQELCD
jgi:hypothetical protein